MTQRASGVPVPYIIAGISTVAVIAAAIFAMGGGGHLVPDDAAGAIKAAKSYMRNTTSVYSTPTPSLIVDDTPKATRTKTGYVVSGRVGFRPAKGQAPKDFTSWKCEVKFDTKRKAWMVADWSRD